MPDQRGFQRSEQKEKGARHILKDFWYVKNLLPVKSRKSERRCVRLGAMCNKGLGRRPELHRYGQGAW